MRTAVAVLAAALLAAPAASAERGTLSLASGREPVERFDGRSPVPVSGQLLVGLRLGVPAGPFRTRQIRVAVGPKLATGRLCLGLASRDGRYAAENLFTASGGSGVTTFDFRSRYQDQVERYGEGAIGILIRDVGDCSSPTAGEFLPALAGPGGEPAPVLTLAVNAPPERLSATLALAPGRTQAAVCEGDRTTVSIAFSSSCTIELPPGGLEGTFELTLSVRERFGPVTRTYPVRFEKRP